MPNPKAPLKICLYFKFKTFCYNINNYNILSGFKKEIVSINWVFLYILMMFKFHLKELSLARLGLVFFTKMC